MDRIPKELAANYDRAYNLLKNAQGEVFHAKQNLLAWCFEKKLLHCLELSPKWRSYIE